MVNFLVFIILAGVASLNVGFVFVSSELIVCISLLLLFYFLFLTFGNLVSSYFFSRIEYIYLFFFELISINLLLVELLLGFLNRLYRFQYKVYSVLENRIFFFKIFKLSHLLDVRLFSRVLLNLLYNFFSFFLANEIKFLVNISDVDSNALLYIKFYHSQGFLK